MVCCRQNVAADDPKLGESDPDKVIIDMTPDEAAIDSPNVSEFVKKWLNMFSPAWGLYTFAVVIVLIIIAMVYFSKSSTLTQFDPENMMFTTFQVDGMDDRIGLFAENTPPRHLCKVLQLSIDDSDGNDVNFRDVILRD
eukprot:298420_1